MDTVGVIPARFGSTRFPGKPLVLVAGKPLLQHVIERCQRADALEEVIVATDDPRIAELAGRFCRVEMTDPNHATGSDRVAEVAARLACQTLVNIQGDEPLIDPAIINAVAAAAAVTGISTAATPLTDPAEYENPNVVKVVVNKEGRALYFSRRVIPYLREAASRSAAEQLAAFAFLKHLGLYGYRRETLLTLRALPESELEKAEMLEQLRALDHGMNIQVVKTNYRGIGVDSPEDVARIEPLLRG